MSDSFSETTTTGYGSRIVSSIKGVVVGLILFVASFCVLYWNEGRVDLSSIAKTATEISSASVNANPSLEGKLISTSGVVSSNQTIGDDLFLKPDKFIAVDRKVEMYAWIEKEESKSTSNTGGSETTETVYTYSKGWEESPEATTNFKSPDGHENPQKIISNYTGKVTTATIGVYSFDPQSVELPDFSHLALNTQNVTLSGDAVLANDTYIFIRKNGTSTTSTFDSPQIGDLRIQYQVLRPEFKGTIFGNLKGSSIDSFSDTDGNSLYRIFAGTRDQGISTLHTEFTTLLWIFRLVGFLLMWFGLSALFGPISILMDILPIFGTISRWLVSVISFVVAFILSVITILVSMVIHNLVALIIALVIVIGVITVLFMKYKGKKAASIPDTSTVPSPIPPPVNQLEEYIKDARTRGMADDQIRQELLTAGWSADDINRNLI